MIVQELIAALALPASCRVDQRVPKKMLVENGAPTATDKRLLNDVIDEILWIAALKPTTVGVPEYRDQERQYLEVAVLSVAMRGVEDPAAAGRSANTTRLAELVHRAVPYPVLLLLATPQGLFLSMAHKRWAQNEVGKVVLDGDVPTIEVPEVLTSTHPFLQSLAMTRQPQGTLMVLYQGWLDCLTALQAAHYTGTYKVLDTPSESAARRATLRECQRLEREAVCLRAQAGKERQMAKQVSCNLALQRVLDELSSTREQL